MLDKELMERRIKFFTILIASFIIAVAYINLHNLEYNKYRKNFLESSIENINPDSVYITNTITTTDTEGNSSTTEDSYIYYNDTIIQVYSSEDSLTYYCKYEDDKTYLYMYNAWIEEDTGLSTPDKLNYSIDDFNSINVAENVDSLSSNTGEMVFTCQLKNYAKSKYLPLSVMEKIGNEYATIDISCNTETNKINSISITASNDEGTIEYTQAISDITDDLILELPTKIIDSSLLSEIYPDATTDSEGKTIKAE